MLPAFVPFCTVLVLLNPMKTPAVAMSSSENKSESETASPSWDAFTVEYERRVESFTSEFADEMMRPILAATCSDDEDEDDDDDVDDYASGAKSPNMKNSRRRKLLLDVGCGTGATSLLALSHGYDVTSTDVSSSMVNRTRQRAIEAGFYNAISNADRTADAPITPTIYGFASDGQSLPLGWSNTFDVAVANFSVIFFPDPVGGLKEMLRCLIPGGVASITAWGNAQQTPAFRVFPDAAAELVPELVSTGKPRRMTGSVSTLTELMKEAGFMDIKVVGPVVKTLLVSSPEEYYNRFALTSPPTAEMIAKMDDATRIEFRSRVMATAKARGGREDGSIALDSSAYIAYGRKPMNK